MSNYEILKSEIRRAIKENGNQEITGDLLQAKLLEMIGTLGEGYTFMGVATPDSKPTSTDARVYYIANEVGMYSYYGGARVEDGEIALLVHNKDWQKMAIGGIVTDVKLQDELNTNYRTRDELNKVLGYGTLERVNGYAYIGMVDNATESVTEIDEHSKVYYMVVSPIDYERLFGETTKAEGYAFAKSVQGKWVIEDLRLPFGVAKSLDTLTKNINTTNTNLSNLTNRVDNLIVQELGDDASKAVSQKVVTDIDSKVAMKMDKQMEAVDGNVAMFEGGEVRDSKIPSGNIAQQNGYYEGMVVGASRSLAGDNEVRAEYVFRPSGGTDIQSGTAIINRVLGKTLVWNQLFPKSIKHVTGNLIAETIDGTTYINGVSNYTFFNFSQTSLYIPLNHIGLYKLKIISDSLNTLDGCRFGLLNRNKDRHITNGFASFIYNNNDDTLGWSLGISSFSKDTEFDAEVIVQVFDLTQMFGEGNEPTTVEEFEAMFPNDYYEYNEGTLISNDAVGIKSVGFNAWDEEWEAGDVSKTGVLGTNPNAIRSANYIKIIPNTNYYISTNNPSVYTTDSIRIRYYDINKNFATVANAYSPNRIYTIPDNCYYMKWCTFSSVAVITKYTKGDICINLSHSGIRDGEYEPYEEHKLLFNNGNKLSTIKGKLNGEGDSVVVFPDGLRSAGDVRDEIVGNVAIKRIGSVDMGSLNWETNKNYLGMFATNSVLDKKQPSLNILNSKYSVLKEYFGYANYQNYSDKIIATNYSANNIYIKDTSYTDATTFKQSLQGQILYYELAEPETYILDEAIPMNYVVDDWGTEQRLVADENEILAPLCYDVTYAINAVDTIRNMPKNYISEETMQAFLSAVGSAMSGTWSMTWNEDMQKYVFTFAPNAVATDVE